MCTCEKGFQAADCSQRTCPFGLAHVDIPKGDLDFSNTISDANSLKVLSSTVFPYGTTEGFPRMVDSAGNIIPESAHEVAECSAKGICDRITGMCQCMPGYEGAACQRASCPDESNMDAEAIKSFNSKVGGLLAQKGDSSAAKDVRSLGTSVQTPFPVPCSGHGTCRTIQELAFLDHENLYTLWDKDSTMGCYCDSGYSGPACADRMCPYGIDPLYTDDATVRVSQQTIRFKTSDSNVLSGVYSLVFYDVFGEDYRTRALNLSPTGVFNSINHCDEVVEALKSLPNGVVQDVGCSQVAFNTNFGFRYTLTFTKNPGKLKEVKVDQYIDGSRPTIGVASGTYTVTVHTKVNGEFVDYFPDRCDGLRIKILADSANADDSWTAATVRPGSLGYISGVNAPLTSAEQRILKACLGDSDWDPNNNIEVANWDTGAVVEASGIAPDQFYMLGAFPHAIKVVPVETTAGYDKFKYGELHLVYYDPTATNKEFRVANLNNGYNLPSEAIESYLYTTKGTVQQLGYGIDSEISDNSASGASSTRIVGYFSKGENKIFTNYDTSCENNPSAGQKNHKCVEKGDLLFIIDGCWAPGDLTAGSINPIFGGTEVYNCADSTVVNYNTGNLYTVTKIHRREYDAASDRLGPTNTIDVSVDPTLKRYVNYNVIEVDANLGWDGLMGDPENSNTAQDDTTWSDNTGIVTLFHFTPSKVNSFEYVSQCSNRGLCNPTDGVCRCFRGYTGNDCSVQSVLAK